MIKKLISITCALTLLLCVFVSPANAATGWQGYAVYRDGVAVIEWHGAIMDKATKDDVYPVVHAVGPGTNVSFGMWSDFLAGKTFMGYYQPKSELLTNSKRDAVTATARRLAADFIGYTVNMQMNYPIIDPPPKPFVQVSDISTIRCDGVIEYCYEYNNIRIYGDNVTWDISRWSEANKALHGLPFITPKVQARNYMTLLDKNP